MKLVDILKQIPQQGVRLDRGLALRLTLGNGFFVLGASRVGVTPSDDEMRVLVAAVKEAWDPKWLFMDEQTTQRPFGNKDKFHVIRRLYWPAQPMVMVAAEGKQAMLEIW